MSPANNREAAQACKILVLSVKPQDLDTVLADLKGKLRPEQMVMSIVAGARISMISRGLGHSNLVARVMPNTPAQIGEGMSVWTATASVKKEQLNHARVILQALGKELYVR